MFLLWQKMGEAGFKSREEAMNNNVGSSASQLPSSSGSNGHQEGAGDVVYAGSLSRPSAHYFRPIPHHSLHLHHPPPLAFASGRDDFDLTSDSDAISSPTSSIIGPPPLPPVGGRPPSPHHMTPLLPCYNNGIIVPPVSAMSQSHLAANPQGFHGGIYSPSGQSGISGSGPLRFDDSSFLGTSDACSSPETGSLPRTSKLTKRKRPPRPPPRRLKSEDYTVPEEDDRHLDDDEDDPHLRHLLARYQQQLAVMTMSMGGRMDDMQVTEEKSLDTAMALSEIRTQLQELTKSVESCQSEVTEVKRDMLTMKNDLDIVQQVKDEIDDLRECVDRIDDQSRRRKSRLLEQGLTVFLSFSIFSAVLGMLQFGYNTGVINAPQKDIERFMKEVYEERNKKGIDDEAVEFLYSIVVSIFAIGGMLGGFSGGIIANRFGRKGGLLLNNLIGICGGFLMGFTKSMRSYEILILGRFIIGINCGLNTSLVPMYVSEIAPLNLRGALGTVNQLAVTVGLLVSQVLGIEQLLGTPDGWPLLLGLAVVPAFLQMALLPMCPESPRYLLMTKQREDEARRALKKFRASQHIEEDIEEMKAEQRAQSSEAKITMLQLLRSSHLQLPLLIAVVMQMSQQLSGINAVLYYSTKLFIKAGLKDSQAKFATPGIGAIMVGMTLISIMLMDRAGRRTLHLYGLGGMFIFSIFITISMLIKEILDWVSYLAVIFTLSFVVFFAVGPGSIPWMITAELFSQGPRPAAMSIAVLTNWFANFLVGILFPVMNAKLKNYVFLPFSVLLAFFWTFTYRKVPETKNKTFEEIAALFKRKPSRVPSDESHIYGIINCVNSVGQPIMHPETSALIDHDKPQSGHSHSHSHPPESSSGRSSRGDLSPPGNAPPPPVPFSIPPYPPRFLDDNAV